MAKSNINQFAAFDTKADEPVTIVLATFNYRKIVENWIAHVCKLGYDGWRIVCMDRELIRWLEERGHGARAVDYYAVFPDAPRYDFDSLPRGKLMPLLQPLRTHLYLQLATAGIDFVNSDADAFWIRDPRPYLWSRYREYDLLMSQDVICPLSHYRRFGFVMCSGFFVCRSNARTRAYFEKVNADALLDWNLLDQQRMNKVLERDGEARWEVRKPVVCIHTHPPRVFPLLSRLPPRFRRSVRWEIYRLGKTLRGARGQGMEDVRTLMEELTELFGKDHGYGFVSKSVIRGRFSDGLTVGVIPMHLVSRYRFSTRKHSLIAHMNCVQPNSKMLLP